MLAPPGLTLVHSCIPRKISLTLGSFSHPEAESVLASFDWSWPSTCFDLRLDGQGYHTTSKLGSSGTLHFIAHTEVTRPSLVSFPDPNAQLSLGLLKVFQTHDSVSSHLSLLSPPPSHAPYLFSLLRLELLSMLLPSPKSAVLSLFTVSTSH